MVRRSSGGSDATDIAPAVSQARTAVVRGAPRSLRHQPSKEDRSGKPLQPGDGAQSTTGPPADYFGGRKDKEPQAGDATDRGFDDIKDLLKEHQMAIQARFNELTARQEELVGGLASQLERQQASGPEVHGQLSGAPATRPPHVPHLHLRDFHTMAPPCRSSVLHGLHGRGTTNSRASAREPCTPKKEAAFEAMQSLADHSKQPLGPLAKAYSKQATGLGSMAAVKSMQSTPSTIGHLTSSIQGTPSTRSGLAAGARGSHGIPNAQGEPVACSPSRSLHCNRSSRMSSTAVVPEDAVLEDAPLDDIALEEPAPGDHPAKGSVKLVDVDRVDPDNKKWLQPMTGSAAGASRSRWSLSSLLGSERSQDQGKPRTLLRDLKDFARSPAFDICCGVTVVLNAIMIGVETEYMTHHGGRSHKGFIIAQAVMNIWFTLELVLRMFADNWRFLTSSDWRWNIFDAILVCFSVVDLIQVAMSGAESVVGSAATGRLLRIIRLSRVIRTLRLCRTLSYIHHFRKMVYSLQASVTTLLWSLILLFSVMFAFSVLFVQGVAEYLQPWEESAAGSEPAHVSLLRTEYGSLFRGCVTLYKSISNGVSWGAIMDPLADVDVSFVFLFLCYISISFFGVLNVVSAVFVESAMASAAHYKDLRIYESRKAKAELVRHMREVFKQIDEDGSGEISFQEMDSFLTDPQLRMYVESLEVTVEDTAMLFQLMDLDDSGVVDIEEFCTGLMRLQGDARSFDLQLLIFEMSKFQKRWDKFVLYVEFMFDEVVDSLYGGIAPEVASERSRLSANAFFGPEEKKRKTTSAQKTGTASAGLGEGSANLNFAAMRKRAAEADDEPVFTL